MRCGRPVRPGVERGWEEVVGMHWGRVRQRSLQSYLLSAPVHSAPLPAPPPPLPIALDWHPIAPGVLFAVVIALEARQTHLMHVDVETSLHGEASCLVAQDGHNGVARDYREASYEDCLEDCRIVLGFFTQACPCVGGIPVGGGLSRWIVSVQLFTGIAVLHF